MQLEIYEGPGQTLKLTFHRKPTRPWLKRRRFFSFLEYLSRYFCCDPT